MNYIVRVEPSKIKNIEALFNVTWKSRVLEGLIFIESDAPPEYIRSFDGVIHCRLERRGTWNDYLGI